MFFIILTALACLCGIVYGSFFEWTLHKFVMHRVIFGFRYAYEAHAQVHHQMYGAGPTYHTNVRSDVKKIPMAWWNGPVLIILSSLPTVFLSWLFDAWWITTGVAIAVSIYYATYEYMHWCMHYPKGRWFEKTSIFRWIDEHHRLHHKHVGKNLNVVLPIADWTLRTLVLPNTASEN